MATLRNTFRRGQLSRISVTAATRVHPGSEPGGRACLTYAAIRSPGLAHAGVAGEHLA